MNEDEAAHGTKWGIILLIGLIGWFAFSGYNMGKADGQTYTDKSGAKVTMLPEGSVCSAPNGEKL